MDDRVSNVVLHEISVSHRTVWRLVEVKTSDGLTGFGECSDTRNPNSPDDVLCAELTRLRDHFPSDPHIFDMELLTPLDHAPQTDATFDRRIVLGAVATALSDIQSRRVGDPLGVCLGGVVRDRVPIYANINRAPVHRETSEFVAAAGRAIEQGFTEIKLAPFDGPPRKGGSLLETGLDILSRVHEEVGDSGNILVDMHHRLSKSELERAIPELEQLGVGWIEDAVDVGEPRQMEWLAENTRLPLAGGERLTTKSEFKKVVEGGWLTYLLIDPKYVGGVLRYREILDAVGDVTVTHHNPTSPVSTAMCAQLTMLTSAMGPLEFAAGEPIDRSLLVDPPELIEGGHLVVSDAPGIGLRLSEDVDEILGEGATRRVWNLDDCG